MGKNFKDRLKVVYERFINLILVFLVVMLSISLIRNISKMKQTQSLVEEEKKRLENLKKEKEEVEKNLQKVHSEEYIEKQLRDKLGMAKEGEIIVILPEESIVRKFAPKPDEEEETLPDPNWKKWLHLFGLI